LRESVAIHNSRVSSSTDSTISTGRFFFNQVAPEDVTDPQALALRSADRRMLAAAIERLPREYREPLILREMEDFSYKEIGALLAIPIGTVMSRLARARKKLEEILRTRGSGKTYESNS
jgi:RNA polymerase sigma factor (sigma-70 family)